jgi:ATP-binding cassette subfamily B protein
MERGRIIATGSHDELTQSNPLYARLAALQFGSGAAGPPNEEVAPGEAAALQ